MLHPTRPRNKTLLIGWDAADWMTIEPLLEQGKLPHLARLIANGSRGPLKTLEPKLSPLLWTTIATGKTTDRHGILNFVEPSPEGDGLRISQSTSRSTKAIWNILSQNDLESLVVGWYASHPSEKIKGAVVTNLLHEGFDHPDKKTAMLQGTVHPELSKAFVCTTPIFRRRP